MTARALLPRRSRGHRTLSGVVAAALFGAAWIAGAAPALAAPSITATPNTGVEDGTTVSIFGSGFDTAKGIYVAYCVLPPGGGLPTPCGGGVDMSGSTGASVWISDNPPPYGEGLARPYDGPGSFQTSVKVTSTIGEFDCREVTCAIVTRADHLSASDRSQDTAVPISFSTPDPEPAPEPPPVEEPTPDPDPVEEPPAPSTDPDPQDTTPEPDVEDTEPEDTEVEEPTVDDDEPADEPRPLPPPGDGPPFPPVPNAEHYAAMAAANAARAAAEDPESEPAPEPASPADPAADGQTGGNWWLLLAVGAIVLVAIGATAVARRRSGAPAAAGSGDPAAPVSTATDPTDHTSSSRGTR